VSLILGVCLPGGYLAQAYFRYDNMLAGPLFPSPKGPVMLCCGGMAPSVRGVQSALPLGSPREGESRQTILLWIGRVAGVGLPSRFQREWAGIRGSHTDHRGSWALLGPQNVQDCARVWF
jgi:hypothetical protein